MILVAILIAYIAIVIWANRSIVTVPFNPLHNDEAVAIEYGDEVVLLNDKGPSNCPHKFRDIDAMVVCSSPSAAKRFKREWTNGGAA